jgi:hypothetical protein
MRYCRKSQKRRLSSISTRKRQDETIFELLACKVSHFDEVCLYELRVREFCTAAMAERPDHISQSLSGNGMQVATLRTIYISADAGFG